MVYRKKRNTGRAMATDEAGIGQKEALAMLDAFASVGATQFDLTITGRSGAKESFRRGVKLADLTRTLPAMLDDATRQQRNVIVRPHGLGVTFIQLDDLKAAILSGLAPAVFLILQTSPANFQAWLATSGAEDKDFARRLRKGTGADATASGATRVAGSLNFKDKYAPNFPRVAIEQAQPGRKTMPAELGLDPTFVSPAAKLVLGRFWGRFRQRKSQIFDEKRVLSKVTAPASRHFAPSPPKFAPVRPAKCQKCPPQSCLCCSKSPLSEFFPKWRLVTRMLGLGLDGERRFGARCGALKAE